MRRLNGIIYISNFEPYLTQDIHAMNVSSFCCLFSVIHSPVEPTDIILGARYFLYILFSDQHFKKGDFCIKKSHIQLLENMKDGVSLNQRSCRERDCWEPRGHSPSQLTRTPSSHLDVFTVSLPGPCQPWSFLPLSLKSFHFFRNSAL